VNGILIDSSAWIEYFKGNQAYHYMKDMIYTNAICTNDIVLSELLPSILHRKENKLAELLKSIKLYIMLIDWREIRDIQLLNLKHGTNNVGIADILIAQNCIQNNLKLISNDRHFQAMANYIPLELYAAAVPP
jgi:predicted nucleic acid-binding protein